MSPVTAAKPNAMATYLANRAGATPSGSQMSTLGNAVTSSLAEMAELAKAKVAHSTLKDIIGSEEQKSDPTKDIASVVSIAKDLAGIDESRSRSTREELAAERQVRQTMQEKLMSMTGQSDSATMQLMMMMFQMQRENDQKWQDRLERIEAQHKEELRRHEEKIRQTENKPKPETQNYLEQLMFGLLQDRLNYQPSDPLDEITRAKNLVSAITPPAAPGQSTDLAKWQFELRKLELDKEAELKREEMQQRMAIEERKAANTERIVGALGPLFSMLGGNKFGGQQPQAPTGTGGFPPPQQQQQAPPPPASPPERHRFRCTNDECNQQWYGDSEDMESACPACGSELEYIGREA